MFNNAQTYFSKQKNYQVKTNTNVLDVRNMLMPKKDIT